MKKSLSDDELWKKCQQSDSITPQDLGIEEMDESFYYTEGKRYIYRGNMNVLQYKMLKWLKSNN